MNDTAATTDLLAVTLAQTLAQEHVADIVETLNEQDIATIAHVLGELPFERAVENPGQAVDRKAAELQMSAFG